MKRLLLLLAVSSATFFISTFSSTLNAQISGFVWDDDDGDGTTNEIAACALVGITVELKDMTGTVIETTMTGAGGAYTVNPVANGPHSIEFSGFFPNAPGTTVYSTLYLATGGTDDSHLNYMQNAGPYISETIGYMGNAITDFNAGVLTGATIAGVLFEDFAADGANDATDPNMVDPVTVCLLVDNGSGTFVPALDAMGNAVPQQAGVIGTYAFGVAPNEGIPPGSYKIEIKNIPTACSGAPYELTQFNFGGATLATDFNNDSDVDPMGLNQSLPFNVASKQNEINGVDAGFYGLGTVSGNVWEDFNGNGVFDGADAGFGGSMVCLFVNDGTGAYIPAVMADGVTPILCTTGPSYMFTDVPPGDYSVSFELTSGLHFLGTPCDAGGGGTIPDPTMAPDMVNDVCYPCTPAALNGYTGEFLVSSCNGQQNIADNIDAMYYQEVSLGDAVFHDGDNDCMNGGAVDQPYLGGDVQLTIERECLPGSGTWTSNFWDTSVPPVGYTATINSAADGSYCFEDLPPGNYRIQVTLPQFWNFSDSQLTGGCQPPTNDGTANGGQDSDIDPTGQVTNWVELESGDPKETDLDIGIWKCMALGGTVWSDGNENGILDNMEAGMNMIELEISAGQNTWNVITDFEPGSTFGGYWEISSYPTAIVTACLAPGEYEVEVVQSNFDLPAGQLINWVSTADGPVAGDVDGDDSGIGSMVTGVVSSGAFFLECGQEPTGEPDDPFPNCDASNNMTVDFGFYFDCTIAQGGQSPFTIYFDCDGSYDDPLCDVGVLDNFCGEMPQANNGTGATPLCPAACSTAGGITGTPHNTSWVSFIAANNCISFDILPSNCQNGTGLQWGVYEAIETPCNGGACVVCDGNCNGGGVLMVSSCDFIPGNQYFLWLDGCNGTWCDYQIDNVVGAGTFTIPPVDNNECIGCLAPNPPLPGDPYILCTGANSATFCVDTDSNTQPNFYDTYVSVYTWEVDGVELPNTTMTNCVSIDFSAYVNGDIVTVQMTDVGNQCSNQFSAPWTVEIQDPAPEDFGFFDVCEEDFPFTPPGDPNMDGFGWQGTPPITYDGNAMTDTYTSMASDVPLPGCNIVQTVDILDWPTAQGPALFVGLCNATDMYTVGNEIGQPTSYPAPLINFQHTFPDGSLAGGGCDSVINLTLELIQVLGEVTISPCIFQQPPNLPLFIYTFNILNPAQASGYDLNYDWVDDMGNVVQAGGVTFSTSIAGCYDVVVYASLPAPAITNDGMGPCEYMFTGPCFDNSDLFPPEPIQDPVWDLAPCVAGGPVTYCIDDNIFTTGGSSLIWLPTNGVIVSGGQSMDNCIEVDWNATGGASLGITVIGPCSSTPYIQSINPIPSPEAFINPIMETCIGACTEITFDDMGTPNPNLTYNWDFGSGIEQNGTGSTGPGPHCVAWAVGGMQTVSLTVIEGSCESAPFTADVNVVDPFLPPTVNCNGGDATSLEFCWNDIGADGYIPTIVTQSGTGTLVYTPGDLCCTVTGLNILETVTIMVESVDLGVCVNVFSLEQECQVQDCEVPILTVDCTLADICLTANVGLVDLSTCVSANLAGTGVYVGNGVTGTDFDPTDASVLEGANVITYNYTTDLGCTNSTNITVNVYALPSAEFTATPDICETGMATIEYTGGMPLPTAFMWNTGGANETMVSGPGPHDLTFAAPGSYTIELITVVNGCESLPVSMPIEVYEQVEAPVIMCASTITSVCFTWVEEPGVTYNVTHISGPMGTPTPGKYVVDGLMQNDEVEISVTAVSTNAFCDDMTDSSICIAQPCVASDVTLTAPLAVCETAAPFAIDASFSVDVFDGTEVITWSSTPTGSVDNNGMFDPSVNTGFVQVDYMANVNGCPYPGTIVIDVQAQVEAPMPVCSDNTVSSVQASWASVSGAASYLVTVDAGAPMTTNDLFIDVTGLTINQTVTICVTAVSGNTECPDAGPECTDCTANACDAGLVDITGAPTDNICETDPIIPLSGVVIMNATGLNLVLNGDETITWSSAPNAGAIDATTGEFDPGVAGPGVHTITYLLEDLNGQCPYTGSVTIEVEAVLIPPTITCVESINDITWTWDADPCASEYIVSIDNSVVGSQAGTSYTATGLMEGQMVTISVEVVSMCACGNVTNSLECTANPCPPINITFSPDNNDFCDGEEPNAFGVNPTVTGSDGSGTGVWSSTGNAVDANGDFDPSSGPGVYDITYTWTEMGCETTWNTSVTIFENPVLSTVLVDPECFLENSGTITVNVQNGTAPYNIQVAGNTVLPGDPTLVPVGNDIPVMVTDVNGCEDILLETITAAPTETIEIDGLINAIFPDSLVMSYSSGVDSIEVDSVVWTLDGVTICADCPDGVVLTDSLINAEQLCATLWYNDGCFIDDCTPVTIRQITQVYFPTVFNPDSDSNPGWIIGSNAIDVINDIAIFDRWGERVFFGEDIPMVNNEAFIWDGKFKERVVVPGVYVFVVNYTTNSGLEERHAADITVLR